MSTAGRPTWTPAMGSDPSRQGGFRAHVPSRQISSKNTPGYNQLKVRQPGQNTTKELKDRDLRRELQQKEKKLLKSKKDQDELDNDEQEDEQQENEQILLDDNAQQSKNKISSIEPKSIDADDTDSSDEDSSDSDDNNDDDEEEAELLKELERIKQEREQEAERKAMEELAARAREQESQVLTGNPLLSGEQDFNIKKRWYDDTVFKNQAKGEIKQQKRFINDTIRNDFHKKFLHKYVQ